MIKYGKIELSKEEYVIINSVMLDHCMSLVSLVEAQRTKENYEKASRLIQVSVSVQNTMFISAIREEKEIPQDMLDYLKSVLEHAYETMTELKDSLLKAGDLNTYKISETQEVVRNIISKIPEESKIIV